MVNNMNVSREEKKIEAIKRLSRMGIIKDAIDQFEKEDIVMVSEQTDFGGYHIGALYWLNNELSNRVEDFEAEYDSLVYLVVRSYTEIGVLDSYFYVSDHKDEWDMDYDDLSDGYAMVYVYNQDIPEFSEFGSIGWKEAGGGIVRTA